MVLSIVVITMNRAEQLVEALRSCIDSALPKETEFVIIDNASTDNTKEVVETLVESSRYPYQYEYEQENLGVGGGRNRGFELARGEYAYFLDDDAIIAPESRQSFFTGPLQMLAIDKSIASITTRIYDTVLDGDRWVATAKQSLCSLPDILFFLGGSHFLRKSYFDTPLYLDIRYAMEELVPSISAIDKGYFNCYYDKVYIIHQPKKNKWIHGSDIKFKLDMQYAATSYASKALLYPRYINPLLWVAYMARCMFYLNTHLNLYKESILLSRSIIKHAKPRKRISFRTLTFIAKRYGLSKVL
jgi:glycosyltransferase involved in cell wall biosynthesis